MKYPLISIIIVAEEYNVYLEESLSKYKNFNYPSFEILVFTAKTCSRKIPQVKFISAPNLVRNPAKRRDLAIKYAKGEWLAFIDDDAYPSKSWLNKSLKYFEDNAITAICGPGITPLDASVLEKASGWISASKIGGGSCTYRFVPAEKRFVDDFPSMNFIVRKKDFAKIGGFDSNYYPGEDTKLCLDLTQKLGKKIIYDPEVLVYHHRRPLFKKHLKQNGGFGLHRGYFARTLPQTSRRLGYFVPSLFALGFLSGPFLYFLMKPLFTFWLLVIILYFTFLLLTSAWVYSKERNWRIAFLVIPGIFLTHIWYGVKFIQGFLAVKSLEH